MQTLSLLTQNICKTGSPHLTPVITGVNIGRPCRPWWSETPLLYTYVGVPCVFSVGIPALEPLLRRVGVSTIVAHSDGRLLGLPHGEISAVLASGSFPPTSHVVFSQLPGTVHALKFLQRSTVSAQPCCHTSPFGRARHWVSFCRPDSVLFLSLGPSPCRAPRRHPYEVFVVVVVVVQATPGGAASP